MEQNKKEFDKYYYTKQALNKAIEDYKGIATISISENRDKWICSFESKEIAVKRVMDEFDNYVIELINGSRV